MKKRYIPVILFLPIILVGISLSVVSLVNIHSQNSISNQVFPTIIPVSYTVASGSASGSPAPVVKQFLIPKRNSFMGTLSIPVLNRTLPIYQGTKDSQLDKGVGHYEDSVLPGENNNSVLSGHRGSVFSKFDKLKIGNKLIVKTADGVFTYKIFQFRIVKADDRTVIVPTPSAILTLTTCYPFRYIGNAPERYIVSAKLISDVSLDSATPEKQNLSGGKVR